MSALYFDARINHDQLQKDIANINKQIGQISTNMQKEGQQIDAITGRIGRGLAGAFSVFAAGNFVKDIAKVRGEFQQLDVAFETMLGSKAEADKLMAEVVQFASRTPFELQDVASGTKQLLAFGIEAGKVIPTLKAMGDVSAGLSVPIERLINNFGQVKTQMKLTGRELRDFQMAGVPVVAELAKNLNVSEMAIQDMVTAGKIGFKEVEEAFISMTSEGGRFSSLMEKQAKTITGLASNFADAWDRMLNSIGQENEGIIAGSIQGAITLVENYEEIIKILKLLIATYGTYKAAVIATALVERSAAAAGNIKAWFELARGIRSAKDAHLAFNIASKANPYALIAGAIASLISYLIIFKKETKSVEDHIDDLNESVDSIGKQIEVNTLISRYDDLKAQTKLTKEEQAELNTTVAKLGEIFPDAVADVDNYGRAIDLVRDKIETLNADLRENARRVAENELAEKQREVNDLLIKQQRLLYAVKNEALYTDDVFGKRYSVAPDEDLQKQREELELVTSDIQKLQEGIGNLKDQIRNIDLIDADAVLQPYKDLFGEVETYSEQEALRIKEELTKLLFLGFGGEAEAQIKTEIDKIASQLALPTIQEQIQQVVADLKSAQSQLNQLRAPGSRATDIQIKDKEAEIKALQEKYNALTGLNSKERDKQQNEEEKARKERLKAIEEYNRDELSLERQLQAEKIALMKEGAERQKAEAELQFQQELDRIAAQQQAYLEAWNASQGFEPGDIGFIAELPEGELERFTQLRVNAETRKNQQIEQINRETANEIKAIWQEVNDVFLSESERDIASINQRYDDLIERAKRAGETDFSSINEARAKAIEESTIETEMRRLQIAEEIEMQRAEISTQGFNRDIEIERKKLEIVKKFAQQKIEILKRSGTEESALEIEQLELYIQAADNGLKELNKKTLSESIYKISEMASAMREFSDEVFGADSQVASLFNELSNGSQILANIASGNFVGAAAGLLQTISGWYQQTVTSAEELTQAERETREEAFRINDLYRERLQLLESLGLISPTDAAIRDVEILNQKLTESRYLLDNYQQNFLLNGKATSATIKEIFDTVFGPNWGVSQLNQAMSDWDAFFQDYLDIIGGEAYKNHPLSAFNFVMDKEKFNEDLNEILVPYL